MVNGCRHPSVMFDLPTNLGIAFTIASISIAIVSKTDISENVFLNTEKKNDLQYALDTLRAGKELKPTDPGFENIVRIARESDNIAVPDGEVYLIETSRPITNKSRRLQLLTRSVSGDGMEISVPLNNQSRNSLQQISEEVQHMERKRSRIFATIEGTFIFLSVILFAI